MRTHGHQTHFGGLPVAEPNQLPQATAGRADDCGDGEIWRYVEVAE
ncbi:hypothetical protein [Embleya sp. NPDC005575]